MPRTIRVAKASAPELFVIGDVALDPSASDGHDGVVIDGRIDNDETLPLLAQMAVVQAQAGAVERESYSKIIPPLSRSCLP